MNENLRDWLSGTSSSFIASFLSGFLLLLIGTFLIHKGTSEEVTQKTAEPLRSVLEGIHAVSSDILMVKSADDNTLKSTLGFESADELPVQGNTVGADLVYVPAADLQKTR